MLAFAHLRTAVAGSAGRIAVSLVSFIGPAVVVCVSTLRVVGLISFVVLRAAVVVRVRVPSLRVVALVSLVVLRAAVVVGISRLRVVGLVPFIVFRAAIVVRLVCSRGRISGAGSLAVGACLRTVFALLSRLVSTCSTSAAGLVDFVRCFDRCELRFAVVFRRLQIGVL